MRKFRLCEKRTSLCPLYPGVKACGQGKVPGLPLRGAPRPPGRSDRGDADELGGRAISAVPSSRLRPHSPVGSRIEAGASRRCVPKRSLGTMGTRDGKKERRTVGQLRMFRLRGESAPLRRITGLGTSPADQGRGLAVRRSGRSTSWCFVRRGGSRGSGATGGCRLRRPGERRSG
jgi:hypothetical protein